MSKWLQEYCHNNHLLFKGLGSNWNKRTFHEYIDWSIYNYFLQLLLFIEKDGSKIKMKRQYHSMQSAISNYSSWLIVSVYSLFKVSSTLLFIKSMLFEIKVSFHNNSLTCSIKFSLKYKHNFSRHRITGGYKPSTWFQERIGINGISVLEY